MDPVPAPRTGYYLALGDSLSQGVQPNAAGVSVMTPDGYPDLVYAALRPIRPGLTELAKCAVEDIPAAVSHLGTITARLKAAAGPGVPTSTPTRPDTRSSPARSGKPPT